MIIKKDSFSCNYILLFWSSFNFLYPYIYLSNQVSHFFFLFSFSFLSCIWTFLLSMKNFFIQQYWTFFKCVSLKHWDSLFHPFNNEDITEIFSSPSRLPTTVSWHTAVQWRKLGTRHEGTTYKFLRTRFSRCFFL